MRTAKYGAAFLLGAMIPIFLWIWVSSVFAVTFGVVEADVTASSTAATVVPEDNIGWFIQNQGSVDIRVGIGRSSVLTTTSGILVEPKDWIAEQNYSGSQQHAVKVISTSSNATVRVVYYVR